MAWPSRTALNSNTVLSSRSAMESMRLISDESFLSGNTSSMLKESVLANQSALHGGLHLHQHQHQHQHSAMPHTVFPFSLRDDDDGNVNSVFAAGWSNAGSTCRNINNMPAAAESPMRLPLFRSSLVDTERLKRSSSFSPDCNVVNEQSGSTSDFNNVSNTAMTDRNMLAHHPEEVQEMSTLIEVESRIRKKKRLTDVQVHALESSFEADKKLEAERKQKLAQQLGLEPRQVAVWFQNRRARSKTKHLEHDFAVLKSKYHAMLAETHKLRSEVSRLTAELEAVTKRDRWCSDRTLGAKSEASRRETQVGAPLQRSGSSDQCMISVDRSLCNRISNAVFKAPAQNAQGADAAARPSLLNSSPQKPSSHEKPVEARASGAACLISEAGHHQHSTSTTDQHAPSINTELVAFLLDSQTNPDSRLEIVDSYTNCSSLTAYLKKVNVACLNDHTKLQQAISDDNCFQHLNLWELTA